MKIMLVSQEYPPETAHGGIGTQTWNKSQALTRLGHTVHVLSCASGPRQQDITTEDRNGVMVHRMRGLEKTCEVNLPPTYWLGYSWTVFQALRRLMQETAFDLINFPEYGAEGFMFQLDRTPWNWVPVIVQLHGPLAMFAERLGWPEPDSEFYRVGTFMERTSIVHADWLMASSSNIADFAAERYQVPRETIDVVHCGIDADMFAPAARRQDQRPTLLFVGNVVASKGIDTVFEAMLRLREKHPSILLRVAGRADDEAAARLTRRAEAAGALKHLEMMGFLGDRSTLPALYQQADVFCSPARHEVGVANVYVEAMACGCPVVASTTGGAPEAVVDGQSGWLVRPDDVEATAAAIDLLLSNRTLRLQMGEAGRRRVLDYFTVERYIGRVMAAYEKAIARSRATLERHHIGEVTTPATVADR